MTNHWDAPPKIVIIAKSCMAATYLARDLGIVGKTIDASPQSIRAGALRGICGVTTAVVADDCADEATLDAVRLTMLGTPGGQILQVSRMADAHATSSA